MNKVTYSSLKLKKKEDITPIKIGDAEIEVKQYISMEDKIDLVDITLQNAQEGKLYNPLKVDMFFHLNLIYLYTNITFTDRQKEDVYKLYDILESNGVVEAVVAAIPDNEYNFLLEKVEEKIANELKYSTTAAAIIAKIINDLPAQAQAMGEIMDNFDPSKYQSVIDFAKAANGGRDIN